MLYFKKDLIARAYQLVEAKGTQDDAKAVSYLTEISMILQNYNATGAYDPQYAANLNQRIRGEYPLIDKLCRLPSNGTPQRDMNSSKGYPYELGLLDTDFFGILVTVLLKKSIIHKMEDALE